MTETKIVIHRDHVPGCALEILRASLDDLEVPVLKRLEALQTLADRRAISPTSYNEAMTLIVRHAAKKKTECVDVARRLLELADAGKLGGTSSEPVAVR